MRKPKWMVDRLDVRIKQLQDYLGPRVKYTSDKWPENKIDKWLMEYLFILKERKYRKK